MTYNTVMRVTYSADSSWENTVIVYAEMKLKFKRMCLNYE